jgi:CheY-like chemotaxis protein
MPRRLLVIDDQPGINAAITRVATGMGFETAAVRKPTEATDVFLSFSPHIVLLDMVMPEKDGIDLLDEMLLTGRPTRFILMSGYGDAYLRLAQGVAAFHGAEPPVVLRKPFRRDDLMTLLRSVLGEDPPPPA